LKKYISEQKSFGNTDGSAIDGLQEEKERGTWSPGRAKIEEP
jgi:hypothetical protein